MRKGFLPVIAIALVYVGLLACGDDSTTTQPEAAETPSAVEPTSVPTTEPTAEPTAMPEPTATTIPTPELTVAPTATPPPSPTATAVSEPAALLGSDIKLSQDCLPGGVLDNAATILTCGLQAIQQVESFSFEGKVDLLALFPVDGAGAGEGAMQLSGVIVAPDKLLFTISMEADGEKIEINAVMVGQDAYVQDPESGQWFKGVPQDADFLGSIQMVGMFQIPNDPDAELGEIVELEDGTKGYTIVSEQTGPQSGMAGIGLPGGILTWIVGVDDFLTREVKVSLEVGGDKPVDFVSMSYSGYNEEFKIEPPEEYTVLPDELMQSEPPGVATVVGLTKNDDGDVEVTFDRPVQVQGTVELYVLEPSTGGWGLPLLGGSGTDTFIFDADAEGRPQLVAGESQIAGFTFPDLESRLVDSDGTGVNLNFDLWTYE
ncbi:MAG: hypothetical protein F4X72_05015 [Dehalococcoidia bacterium]|nr:hypothetical protein [Dehalococcoidia bacterium]